MSRELGNSDEFQQLGKIFSSLLLFVLNPSHQTVKHFILFKLNVRIQHKIKVGTVYYRQWFTSGLLFSKADLEVILELFYHKTIFLEFLASESICFYQLFEFYISNSSLLFHTAHFTVKYGKFSCAQYEWIYAVITLTA